MPEVQLAMTTPKQPEQAMTTSQPIQQYDSQVQSSIESGAYNRREVDCGGYKSTANFCNIFTDDVAKVHGINLPRIAEMPSWKSRPEQIRQNAQLPAKQGDLNDFLGVGSKDKNSGITRVNKKTAKKLADQGEFVYYSRTLHGSVVAPNIGSKWSVIYRQDQASRRDKKFKVGYGEPKDFTMDDGRVVTEGLYHIEPDKFNKYREVGIQKHKERFFKKWGEPYPLER